jgi:hypothetical protein
LQHGDQALTARHRQYEQGQGRQEYPSDRGTQDGPHEPERHRRERKFLHEEDIAQVPEQPYARQCYQQQEALAMW